VIACSDSASNALLRANAPVLGESLCAVDRRRIYTRAGVDLVLAAVGLHGALVGQLAGGVVGAVGVEDVVFDERRAGPAVDAEVGVAVGLEGAAVLDGSGSKRILSAMLMREWGCCCRYCGGIISYLAEPGFQPFPETKLPTLLQLTLYWPPLPWL
jgi:hypothetical protein